MRYLILLCLVPSLAQATDLHINVFLVVKQDRVAPEPKTVHANLEHHFVLREDGSLEDKFRAAGRFPEDKQRTSKLGKSLKVIDNRTIRKTWRVGEQTRELTITAVGKSCIAEMKIKNASGAFQSLSTSLNTMAVYRNTSVEKIDCRIE
jgi:hypothetical protein